MLRSTPRPTLPYPLAIGLGLAGGTILLVLMWSWLTFRRISVRPTLPAPTIGEVAPTPTPKPPYDSYLLLGYGGGNHAGGRLTDTIIAVFVDRQRERITLLSLPRDLWVQLPTESGQTTGWKLNAAYAIGADDRRYPHKPVEFTGPAGGGQLAKLAVTQVLGTSIEHFVALDFTGFIRSIDILGGVDVQIATTFTDPWYPLEGEEENPCGKSPEEIAVITATASAEQAQQQFPCRYETLHFDRGHQHLDGVTALKYVRSRHSPEAGNDFSRAQRQREVLLAVKNRLLSINFLPKAIPFVNTLAGHLQTDLALDQMQKLVGEAGTLSQYEVRSLALTDQNLLEQGRSLDRQYALFPRAGEGEFNDIQTWLQVELATPSAQVDKNLTP